MRGFHGCSKGADADAARVRALAAYKDFLALWKERDRVPVLDRHVAALEELKPDVGDPDLLQRPPEGLASEVEVPFVAAAAVDEDGAQRAQRGGVPGGHAHRVPL